MNEYLVFLLATLNQRNPSDAAAPTPVSATIV